MRSKKLKHLEILIYERILMLINIALSYIGITPDFGSEKRGSIPRRATLFIMQKWCGSSVG